MDGAGGEDHFLAIAAITGTFVLDVDLAENLLAFVDNDGGRDVTLVVVNVDGVPFLGSELGGLAVAAPVVVETANVFGHFEENLKNKMNVTKVCTVMYLLTLAYLERSNVLLVLVTSPREVGSDLSSVVPDAAHHGFSGLVPQGNVLIGLLAREGVQGTEETTDNLGWREWIASTEVSPFVQHDTDNRTGAFGASGTVTGWWTSFEFADDHQHVVEVGSLLLLGDLVVGEEGELGGVVDEAKDGSFFTVVPQDGERGATTDLKEQ